MSKEFEELKAKANKYEQGRLVKRKEAYHYAKSLGFGFAMARRLMGSSKERIDRLSKEL